MNTNPVDRQGGMDPVTVSLNTIYPAFTGAFFSFLQLSGIKVLSRVTQSQIKDTHPLTLRAKRKLGIWGEAVFGNEIKI